MTLQSLVRSHFEICLEPLKTDQVFPPPPSFSSQYSRRRLRRACLTAFSSSSALWPSVAAGDRSCHIRFFFCMHIHPSSWRRHYQCPIHLVFTCVLYSPCFTYSFFACRLLFLGYSFAASFVVLNIPLAFPFLDTTHPLPPPSRPSAH